MAQISLFLTYEMKYKQGQLRFGKTRLASSNINNKSENTKSLLV